MSAYVVAREHIDILLKAAFVYVNAGPIQGHRLSWFTEDPEVVGYERAYATRRELDLGNADEVGRMLLEENIASVCARYEDDTADQYEHLLAYTYRDPVYTPTVVEAIKAVKCYRYQSCEHDGWRDSQASRFHDRLLAELINVLPGIEEAPWSWNADELRRARGLAARAAT